MVSPVHFLGHSQLCHVHLFVDVLQAVLKVLRQTVDSTVGQRGVDGVQRCKADVLQTCSAIQILRPELNILQNDTEEAANASVPPIAFSTLSCQIWIRSAHLYACLQLQQLNDELFGHNPAEVGLSKQQRVVFFAFSPRRCQDKLVRPEERIKVFVVEVFLLTGAAVGRRPQIHRVSRELNILEASGENCHNDR